MKSEFTASQALQQNAPVKVAFVNPTKVHQTQMQKNLAKITGFKS